MSLGWKEMSLIGVGLLVLFGPAKLPELGRALGKTVREFRKASKEDPEEKPEEPK
jgi:sec-independent protein translocase protein TatA